MGIIDSLAHSISSTTNSTGNLGGAVGTVFDGHNPISKGIKELFGQDSYQRNFGPLFTKSNFIEDKIGLADSSMKAKYKYYPDNLYDPARASKVPTIIFFINVNEEGKFTGRQGGEQDAPIAGQNRLSAGSAGGAQAVGQSITKGANNLYSKVVGGIKSLMPGISSESDKVKTFGASSDAVNGQVKKEMVEPADKDVKEKGGFLTKTMKRLDKAIALPMPQNIAVQYNASYDTVEAGIAGALLDQNLTPSALNSGASEAWKKHKSKYITALTSGVLDTLTPGQPGTVLKQKMGIAMNPRREVVFRDIEKRRFAYQFNFTPSSEAEYQTVADIIDSFKIHMHPEFLDDLRILYQTPSEFDIEYHFGGTKNESLHKISTCYLEHVGVNYTPNGQWSFHDGGFPTHIILDLAFIEAETMTRERILEAETGVDRKGDYFVSKGLLPGGNTQEQANEIIEHGKENGMGNFASTGIR